MYVLCIRTLPCFWKHTACICVTVNILSTGFGNSHDKIACGIACALLCILYHALSLVTACHHLCTGNASETVFIFRWTQLRDPYNEIPYALTVWESKCSLWIGAWRGSTDYRTGTVAVPSLPEQLGLWQHHQLPVMQQDDPFKVIFCSV